MDDNINSVDTDWVVNEYIIYNCNFYYNSFI